MLGPILEGESILLESAEDMPNMVKLDQILHQVYDEYKNYGTEVSHDFKIVESFSTPDGKFGD
jgi:hypothetical protein